MGNVSKISYLKNKAWNDEISRTEKLFCAELFFLLKERENLLKFIKFIEKIRLEMGDYYVDYDVGYEVAFYRDFSKINEFTDKEKSKYSLHRTFDLALFSEKNIYIIEAKAQQGFNNKQLKYFKKDKKKVPEILKKTNHEANVEVHLLALISSKYTLKLETEGIFDKIITWKELYELYNKEIFNKADEIYGK